MQLILSSNSNSIDISFVLQCKLDSKIVFDDRVFEWWALTRTSTHKLASVLKIFTFIYIIVIIDDIVSADDTSEIFYAIFVIFRVAD